MRISWIFLGDLCNITPGSQEKFWIGFATDFNHVKMRTQTILFSGYPHSLSSNGWWILIPMASIILMVELNAQVYKLARQSVRPERQR